MEPLYMTSGILIPSKTYSKEIAMKFSTVKKKSGVTSMMTLTCAVQ